MIKVLFAITIITFFPTHATAQSIKAGRDRDQKEIGMVRTDVPPVIDGVLDEPEWQSAAIIDDFHQMIPVEYAEPSERTEVRLLFDDDALYVGLKLFIDPKLITKNVLRRNGSIFNGDDTVTIVIDPFNNKRGGYYFAVNANGVRGDGLYRNVSSFYGDWDSIHFVETQIVADGWIAEFAIPYKSISFDPNSDTWGLNITRRIRSRGEEMAWVSNDRRTDPSSSGLATGLQGLNQGLGLDIVPSVSIGQERVFDPVTSEANFEPSLDMFYKITPGLNASLTVNTDFSATEVDDRQVNLTRFSLFFPEKRDFFLREADIFEFGRLSQNGRPFFSRKIGLGRDGESIDLEVGGKISGRIGDWEIGALSIRQDESSGLEADTLSVVRLKTGVFSESTIGVIATEGDPSSNIDNSLIGVDFFYRNSHLRGGRVFEASSWIQQTDTDGISSNDRAAGISVSFPSQEGVSSNVAFNRYEENFNPALGFINRVGVDQMTGELNYIWRPDNSYWQSIKFGSNFERFNDSNGDLQSESLSVTPFEITTRTGGGILIRSTFDSEVLDRSFQIYRGVVIPVGEYDFENLNIEFFSAPFRKISGRIAFLDGTFYDGKQSRVFGNISWQPSPKISTKIGFDVTDVELPQGDFTTRLLTTGFDYVFSNSLSLVNLIQYDNISDTMGVNLRLHWIPEEGQEFFFVINHNLRDNDRDNRFHSGFSSVVSKFSYTFRY